VPDLRTLAADELSLSVDPRVAAVAESIAGMHGAASRAVLFYGSCLREQKLEGLVLDFYLIVSNYRDAYAKRWLAIANRLIPPNVFYFEHNGFAAKYAVMSEEHFRRECGLGARTSSVFARFAQPSRLAWAANEEAREMAIEAVSRAAPALLELTRPTMSDDEAADVLAMWKKAFAYTYAAEIRAERNSRPESIVDADPKRYQRFAEAAGFPRQCGYSVGQMRASGHAWRHFQRRGKRASVLRLAKASLTFAGGADYIAWKVNRHAGSDIQLKPWQQRHPLLAAITLLPRLLKSGAIR
jgi:hypothetical protein